MSLSPDRLTFGAACLGNLFEEMSDAYAQHLLETAWEAGIRSFDTAPHYGLGLSKERLGGFLRHVSVGEAQVSTKVGRLLIEDPTGGDRWDVDLLQRKSGVR